MRVYRKRYQKGGRFHAFFKVELSDHELQTLRSARLMEYKVHTHAGSLIGKNISPIAIVNAFQSQINRIRNRWSIALVRTSGSVFIDAVFFLFRLFKELLVLYWRIFFGTRKRFSHLLRGIKVSAKRVEDLKEAEVFVLTSIAAIHQALRYAVDITRDDVFEGDEYRREIEGLTFAGAALLTGVAAENAGGNFPGRYGADDADTEDDIDADFEDVASADGVDIPDVGGA